MKEYKNIPRQITAPVLIIASPSGIESPPEDLAGAPHGRSAKGLSCIGSTHDGAARKDHGGTNENAVENRAGVIG